MLLLKAKSSKIKVSIIGLGFVGLSLAVTSSQRGFMTVGADINKTKIANLKSGVSDFYEPQIENLLHKSINTSSIEFTTNLHYAIQNTDLSFLTVGTPSTKSGGIDLSYIKQVIKQVYRILKTKKSYHLLVIKSTVAPQTTNDVILPVFQSLIRKGKMDVVVNPEFLREGHAIKDIYEPHLIVIGQYNSKSGKFLRKYYSDFYPKLPKIIYTDLTTAELIKYANNSFLATKISFINSIANICQKIPGTDVNTVARAIGMDSRIGPDFLQAGPGFGGSCLPKDLSALIDFSTKIGDNNEFFKAVRGVNEIQLQGIMDLMKEMKSFSKNKKIAILGLAFKKDTDDVREAVSVKLVRKLIKKGLKIKVHDPMAINSFQAIFGNKISYHKEIEDCLTNSECCIILTEWNQYKKLKQTDFTHHMKFPNVIDARRILDPKKFSKINFKAIGLGYDKFRIKKN